jgi:membrane protein DedA with SNARE-associated domain
MTDSFFEIFTTYGIWGIFVCAYLSCLLIPIPTSLMMLAGGALIAAGDLSASSLILTAFLGAVLGDQTGYAIGRKAGQHVLPRLERTPARAKAIAHAKDIVAKRGGLGVFFSTWLFAPLGPYVNVTAGAAGLPWLRFTFWDILGEAIWVNVYVWTGYMFADRLSEIADFMSNITGLLIALGVAVLTGLWIFIAIRQQKSNAKATVLRDE